MTLFYIYTRIILYLSFICHSSVETMVFKALETHKLQLFVAKYKQYTDHLLKKKEVIIEGKIPVHGNTTLIIHFNRIKLHCTLAVVYIIMSSKWTQRQTGPMCSISQR